MITELTLRNFKAFGDTPQRLPIKPLTLIFGANSSGKSSLLHSLMYFRHLWENGRPDAFQLKKLAETVDLGGFRQFVFNQENTRKVELGVRLAPTATSSAAFRNVTKDQPLMVRIQVGMNEGAPASVDAVEFWCGGTRLAALEGGTSGVLVWKDALPLLEALSGCDGEGLGNAVQGALGRILAGSEKEKIEKLMADFARRMAERLNAVGSPSGDRLLEVRCSRLARDFRELVGSDDGFKHLFPGSDEVDPLTLDVDDFLEAIGSEFTGPLSYLGPLRFYPPRQLTAAVMNDPGWVSGGGGAWSRVFAQPDLRALVNEALTRMRIPYRLELRQWVDAVRPTDCRPELVLQDEAGRCLSARDIGVGVSQVIPVVASAVGSAMHILAVEQPEIHLHPALQAELGDVFIESALGGRKNTFLLETHSEHLILRILRRVRETTAGTLPPGMPPVRPEDVSVVYVQPGPNGSEIIELPVTPDGDFDRPWPGGFFAERFQDLP